MKIRITNMLRLAEAEFELNPGRVTCITGRNEAGKTSLATITAALLAGDANPAGASKGQGQVYVRRGADAGEALLSVDDGRPVARWLAHTGEIARASSRMSPSSPGAVGLVRFCLPMSNAARTALWEGYFLPSIDALEEQIREALKPYVAPKVLEGLVAHVREEGSFNSVVKAYQTRARDAKREWTLVTGEEWGSKKGSDWLPAGWLAELDRHTRDTASAALEDAREALKVHQIEHAVDAAIIAQAEDARARTPECEQKVAAVRSALDDASAKLNELKASFGPDNLRKQEAERAKARADDRLNAIDVTIARHRDDEPGAVPNLETRELRHQRQIIHDLKMREPARQTFLGDVSRVERQLIDLEAMPPQQQRVSEGIPCPHCDGRLILVHDGAPRLEPYDIEAARRESEDLHRRLTTRWEAERATLNTTINRMNADADKAHGQALSQWRLDIESAESRLAALESDTRAAHERAVSGWNERAKELAADRAVEAENHAAACEALVMAAKAVSENHERAQPLRDEHARLIGKLQDALVELETQQNLAGQADGKVARTAEMVEAEADADRAVETARRHAELVDKRFDARAHHENVIAYQTVAQVLGPRGVRAQAVETAIEAFDRVLETIATVTGWPRVALDRGYAISIGDDRIVSLAAESAQLRAQWCLQIAIARAKREPAVILDAADHLDAENMTGLQNLIAALCARPQPSAFLVCGTAVPHFDVTEFNPGGLNYRLDDGTLRKV
ncbi:MAG: hypothetical protein OXC08_20695 [Thiotrichales bacterium]|nr:hypothetical protein [Thiotrichales bacterium]